MHGSKNKGKYADKKKELDYVNNNDVIWLDLLDLQSRSSN